MYERIMGLNIINEKMYQEYRKNMLPILESYGGSFGFDFRVAEVLKSKTDDAINRVFTIEFANEATMNAFFNDENYLAVKKQYLDHSIDNKTVISMHEKNL